MYHGRWKGFGGAVLGIQNNTTAGICNGSYHLNSSIMLSRFRQRLNDSLKSILICTLIPMLRWL